MLQQASFYAGYAGEMPRSLRHLAWSGPGGSARPRASRTSARGDTMAFSAARAHHHAAPTRARNEQAEETRGLQINERQIFLTGSDLVLDYRARGDRMTLVDDTGAARLRLTRISATD